MKNDNIRIWSVILSTVFALTLNGLAETLPLNGRTTASISDSFNVLFVPAGYVFSIWGIIYLGIIAYTIYQALPSKREDPDMRSTGWLVTLSSIFNGLWIVLWHYGYYLLTLVDMLALLTVLIMVYVRLDIGRRVFSTMEKWMVSIPFSIYLGWITVATIANATAVFSSLGFSGAGIDPQVWVVILLAVGVILAALAAFIRADVAYLLVLVWAFVGISVKWPNLTIVNPAGYAAAGAVALLLVVGYIRKLQSQKVHATVSNK